MESVKLRRAIVIELGAPYGSYKRRPARRDRKPVQDAVRTVEDLQDRIAQRAAKFPLRGWPRHKLDTMETCIAPLATNV